MDAGITSAGAPPGIEVTRPNIPDTAHLFSNIVPCAAAQHLVDVASGLAAGNLIKTATLIWPSLLGLILWLLFTYITTWFGLSKAQPAPLRPTWMRRT